MKHVSVRALSAYEIDHNYWYGYHSDWSIWVGPCKKVDDSWQNYEIDRNHHHGSQSDWSSIPLINEIGPCKKVDDWF